MILIIMVFTSFFWTAGRKKEELSNFDLLLSEHLRTSNELNSVEKTTSGTIQKKF
jgi:hypothetical protein